MSQSLWQPLQEPDIHLLLARAKIKPPGNLDVGALCADLNQAGNIYHRVKRYAAEPTVKARHDAIMELRRKTGALIEAMEKLLPEGSLAFNDLGNALGELEGRAKIGTNGGGDEGTPSEAALAEEAGAIAIGRLHQDLRIFAAALDRVAPEYASRKGDEGWPGPVRFHGHDEEPQSPEVWLIAQELPRLYERHIDPKFGTSVHSIDGKVDGPGVRFVSAALEVLEVRQADALEYSPATIRRYWRDARLPRVRMA